MLGETLSSDFLREVAHNDEVQHAVDEFNSSPHRGVASLCRVYGTDTSPRGIAHLLHIVPDLLPEQVGEFLSRQENCLIQAAYFQELDLRRPFLDALREALGSGLHLPRESQRIGRVLQSWARCWVSQCPDCAYDGDQAYVLAFACILLNSDLHNPNATHRMSAADFVDTIHGAIPNHAISDRELSAMYDSIKASPFTFRRTSGDNVLSLSAP
jgi:Sec7-like guanine-nucleotide exchange factor